MAAAPLNKVERAHHMYREGRYEGALGFYTEALAIAKTNPQKIALHSNRAACFLKLHDFRKAADECTSVLELDHKHTGALMLRAQTLVTLKEYQSALFVVNRLLELNSSSEVYLNLQARLKAQLSLAPIPEAETELEESDDDSSEEMSRNGELAVYIEGGSEEVDTMMGAVAKTGRDADTLKGSSTPETNVTQQSSHSHPTKCEVIPKPKGHSRLDYSRWDRVVDDSSDDEDDDEDDEEVQPRYRFRVKTVNVRPVR